MIDAAPAAAVDWSTVASMLHSPGNTMSADRADQIQAEIREKLTMGERLHLAREMSDLARGLLRARIRMEHPDWSERQVAREVLRAAFAPHDCPI